MSEYHCYYVGNDLSGATRSDVVTQLRSLKMKFTKCGGGTGTISVNHLFDRYMTLISQLPEDVNDWVISLLELFDFALTKRIREQMSDTYKSPPASLLVTMQDQINALCKIWSEAVTATTAICCHREEYLEERSSTDFCVGHQRGRFMHIQSGTAFWPTRGDR